MKKSSLLLLLALGAALSSFAQTFKIYHPGNPNALNDSTVTIYGGINQELVSKFNVINLTSSPIDSVMVKRIKVSVLGNTINAICWANTCYDTLHNVSDSSEIIGAHDTAQLSNGFYGDYYPLGQIGTSTFRYVFFNKFRPTTQADTVTVNYVSTTTSIAHLSSGQIGFYTPYPNPAGNMVTFGYNFSNGAQAATLKLFNMLGECIQTLPLNTSKIKAMLNVQAIPSGIYICEIQANGCQPAFQKLVVSH